MKQFFPVFAVAFSLLIAGGSSAATSPSPSSALEAIRRAPDPSTVVAAYANATAEEANDPRLLNAYVSRMVDLGEPDMAYQQAESLKAVEPHNGLAWAVVAYVDGHRGKMADALTACERAALYAPNNRFVQQTAGGLLAWYDRSPTRGSLPPTVQENATTIRKRLGPETAFRTSYDYASQTEQSPVTSEQSPVTSVPNQVGPVPLTNSIPMSATPAYDSTYAPQYVYPPEYVYPPQYTYGPDYYGWPWWGSPGYFYGSAVIPFGSVFVFGPHYGFHGHSYYYGHAFHGYGHAGPAFSGHAFAHSAPRGGFGGGFRGGMGGMGHGGGRGGGHH